MKTKFNVGSNNKQVGTDDTTQIQVGLLPVVALVGAIIIVVLAIIKYT